MLSIIEREIVDSGTDVDNPPAPGHLVHYDAACRAVAEARTIDEVRAIAANAEAVRAYARQARNRQLEIDAAEIRLRAERRVGELMAAQRDAVGVNKGGGDRKSDHRVEGKPGDPATLAEAGIDKNLAHRARTLAAVADEAFEELLDDKRRSKDRRVALGPNAPRALAPALKAENEALSREVSALKARNEALTQEVVALKAENEALIQEAQKVAALHKQAIRRLEDLGMKWKERAMIAEDG